MKVLVTGGAGFIGGYVCTALAEAGHEPLIFDHHDRGGYQYPVILGDVRDATAVTEAMAHATGWIHLAAVLGTQETISNPRPSAESNLLGGLNMLEAAVQYDVPGVYIGVGNHWMNNSYSISKTMVERYADMYNKNRGAKVNIVRAMNAYGPGQIATPPWDTSRVRKITPAFICRALAGLPLEVYGDGEQISDMIYASDVARALVLALEAAHTGNVFGRAVEIGPEKNNTVRQVAELIIQLCKSRSLIQHLPMRPGETAHAVVCADTDTLKMVGMTPDELVPLRQGLTATVKDFQSRYF